MVVLTITPIAKCAIDLYLGLEDGSRIQANDDPALKDASVGGPISHGQLLHILRALKAHGTERVLIEGAKAQRLTLDALLRGSKPYVEPSKPKPEQTPQYVALMARLRVEEERRAYERLINPPQLPENFSQRFPSANAHAFSIDTGAMPDDIDDVTFTEVNRQMTLIINVLVSIICCAVGIWIAARHWSTPSRLGLSMTGSGVVAFAEVAIYMSYIKRIKDSKLVERKLQEQKEVAETWVIEGKKGSSTARSADSVRLRKGKHR